MAWPKLLVPVSKVLALTGAVLLGWGSGLTPGAAQPLTEGLVSHVISGDALDAHVNQQRTALRYLGAQAPSPDQPCGPEALARNQVLANGRVLLEEDARYRYDTTGARLFYAYTPNGQSIDAALITEGLARAVRGDAAHGPELAALETEAKAAGRGCLWDGTGSPRPPQFVARLNGFQETPSISTRAHGRFEARIARDSFTFVLSYEDLEAPVTAAHIHFGQRHTVGGVGVFLCGGGGKPTCPQSGKVTGTIVAADVIGPAAQGIAPGEFRELLRAIRVGATYANVHSALFPAGEIRGQIVRADTPPDQDDADAE